ncbi:MAG TPA: MauE/DoxX family redox-associated membrane protein [Myxococcota bacterium]|nr:MauE/DoxX family redox-associated membrane protein [Myxococcota bacterium]
MSALDPAFGWTASAALALVFAQAAWHKLRDLGAFAAAVAAYELLPAPLAPLLATQLAAAELVLVGALLLPPARAGASLAAFALLCIYSAAIATNLARGRRDIDCGCTGPALRQPLSGWLLARNAALGALALLGAAPASQRALGLADALPIAGGALALFALVLAANQLAANAPASRTLHARRRAAEARR